MNTHIVKKIRLGDEVVTYCGKCKEERTHQVVALDSAKGVERVVCRTCNSNHLYRGPKTATAKTVARRSPREDSSKLAPATPRQVRPYSTAETYEADQWISHPKFGQGRVVEVKGGGKIAVQFGREMRTLLHAG